MNETDDKKTKKKSTGIPASVLDLAAYGSAATVGTIQGHSAINEAIYEQNKGLVEIKDLRTLRDKNMHDQATNFQSIPHKSAREFRRIQKDYEKDVAAVLEEKYGLRGTRDYWTALTDTNRNKVIFERVLTPVGIVLGATLAIANIGSIQRFLSGSPKNER
jgi:hypothetical protein